MIERSESLLIVISGPSGAGKTSLAEGLVARHKDCRLSLSATTRPPRGGEVDGRAYRFITREAFEARRAAGAFVEWAVVHDHLYGTPADFVDRCRREGLSVVFDIDVQGAVQVRERYPDAVLIFVIPPFPAVLRSRLEGRRTDAPDVIEKRMRNALEEIRWIEKFDYLLVNDRLEATEADLETVVRAERLRVARAEWPDFLAEEGR